MFAADVNANGDISIADLLSMRKVLIGAQEGYDAGAPWLFVDNSFTIADPANPFAEKAEATDIRIKPLETAYDFDVRAIKLGDLNGTVKLNGLIESEIRNSEPLVLEAIDRTWNPGEQVEVTLLSPNIEGFAGFQGTLQYGAELLDLKEIRTEDITLTEGVNYFVQAATGSIALALDWTGSLDANAKTMTLVFEARRKGSLKQALQMNGGLLVPEAVSQDLDITEVTLKIRSDVVSNDTKEPFVLLGNQPNPFNGETTISFELPEAGDITLVVYDLSGRQIYEKNAYFYKGYNQMAVTRQDLGVTGLLVYQIRTAHGTATQRMLVNE